MTNKGRGCPPTRLLRRREVESLTGLRRTAIYEAMARGQFPRPIALTARSVAWPERDVQSWIEARLVAAGRAP